MIVDTTTLISNTIYYKSASSQYLAKDFITTNQSQGSRMGFNCFHSEDFMEV